MIHEDESIRRAILDAAKNAEAGEVIAWVTTTAPAESGWNYGDCAPREPTAEELDAIRDLGFGSTEGPAVYAYTETHVIVPIQYDGAQDWAAVPLSPNWPSDWRSTFLGGG